MNTLKEYMDEKMDRLRLCMYEKNITQEKLSEILGCSRNSVYNFMSKRRVPSTRIQYQIDKFIKSVGLEEQKDTAKQNEYEKQNEKNNNKKKKKSHPKKLAKSLI